MRSSPVLGRGTSTSRNSAPGAAAALTSASIVRGGSSAAAAVVAWGRVAVTVGTALAQLALGEGSGLVAGAAAEPLATGEPLAAGEPLGSVDALGSGDGDTRLQAACGSGLVRSPNSCQNWRICAASKDSRGRTRSQMRAAYGHFISSKRAMTGPIWPAGMLQTG